MSYIYVERLSVLFSLNFFASEVYPDSRLVESNTGNNCRSFEETQHNLVLASTKNLVLACLSRSEFTLFAERVHLLLHYGLTFTDE